MNFVQSSAVPDSVDRSGGFAAFADRNTCTAAAVIVGGTTLGLGGAVALAVAPAHMTLLAGSTAALAYVGDRQSRNLPINPFGKSDAVDGTPASDAVSPA